MSGSEIFPFEVASEPAVRGFLHCPLNPCGDGMVLTHGAGSNCSAPLLVGLADALCQSGMMVLRCDLPFRQRQPEGPPPRGSAEVDQAGLRCALESLRVEVPGWIFLGGHSYGGRQSSRLAATEPELVAALLLLSYPLHPPKRPEQLRTTHFPSLRTPALFVHGSRDGFGSLDELTTAMTLVPAKTELFPVMSAGHDLFTRKNQQELPRLIAEKFQAFVGAMR